jgi:ATP-binding cassette subfamily F protein 3
MDLVDAVIADRAVQFSFPQPDELGSPLIAIRGVDVGYTEGNPVLRRIFENIDPDDRIALLGANGNGKSTMIKLIAGKLTPVGGEMVRSGKLRIGYFSQHQTEELDVNETPVQSMTRMVRQKTGTAKESQVRARLGQFGFSKDLADNLIGKLSGGEKARLLFAFMSYDAPHLLLLDEPTNHLDVDAREALVNALNAYKGAVVMVSHDPSMVERVADRLWLVKDGKCDTFDGDLQDYRDFIIESRREERREEKKARESKEAPPAPKVVSSVPSQKDLERLEKKIAELTEEKVSLEQEMAERASSADFAAMRAMQEKYALVCARLEEQERIWLEKAG